MWHLNCRNKQCSILPGESKNLVVHQLIVKAVLPHCLCQHLHVAVIQYGYLVAKQHLELDFLGNVCKNYMCSSTQIPEISQNNNNLPNPVGNTPKTSCRLCAKNYKSHLFASH